jgi:hypothetical protein
MDRFQPTTGDMFIAAVRGLIMFGLVIVGVGLAMGAVAGRYDPGVLRLRDVGERVGGGRAARYVLVGR